MKTNLSGYQFIFFTSFKLCDYLVALIISGFLGFENFYLRFLCNYLFDLIHLVFRQEDRDVGSNSSHPDISEKLARMSIDDASLSDWHLGFHISLVLLANSGHAMTISFECVCFKV